MIPNFLKDLDQDSIKLIIDGTVSTSSFDDVGNILLPIDEKSISSFLYVPMNNMIIDENQVKNRYEIEFTEFVETDVTSDSQVLTNTELLNELQTTKQQLSLTQNQLSESIEKYSGIDNAQALVDSTKNLIISLRIQLGQGKTTSDFQNEYPWKPINSGSLT